MIFDLSESPGSAADNVVVPPLSERTLHDLFSSALKVLKLEPWKKLDDIDWFGIKDPESGNTHIAAVMGAAGEVFAVHAYLPEEGIRFWNRFIRTGKVSPATAMREMNMVSCEFVEWNGEDMDETDAQRNDTYCDDFEPGVLDSCLFRSTRPGCIGWHPDEEEAVMLLDALRLVPVFVKDFPGLPPHCYEPDPGESLPKIPVYEMRKNGDRANPADWILKFERFPEAAPEPEVLPDELFPARLAAFPVKKGQVWEIASDYIKTPVVYDGRPTWMTLTVAVAQSSGMAFGTTLHPVSEPREAALRKALLAAAEQSGFLPGAVWIRSEIAREALRDIPGVEISLHPDLPAFDEVSNLLSRNFDEAPENHPLGEIAPEAAARLQEFIARYPSPETLSPAGMKQMMAELMEIEGAEALFKHFTSQREPAQPAPPAPSKDRYILRIELQQTERPVWRELSIATDATFSDLHHAIQSLFDWDGGHCHTFQIRKGRRIESSIGPDDEYDDRSEYETPLTEIFKRKGSKITYVYDFGDNWELLVTQQAKVPAKKGETGPICLGGKNIAPPEDCSGVMGFEQLLDPESGYAEEYEFDEKYIKHLRDGKFSPKDVKF